MLEHVAGQVPNMLEDLLLLKQLFFERDFLKSAVEICASKVYHVDHDPLTDVAVTMLSEPLSLAVNALGYLPFLSNTDIVIPFSHMSAAQKTSLKKMIVRHRNNNALLTSGVIPGDTVVYLSSQHKVYVDCFLLQEILTQILSKSIHENKNQITFAFISRLRALVPNTLLQSKKMKVTAENDISETNTRPAL